MKLIPKNWSNFQHYKDRCPPWIKLHRDILNNRDFISLPIASKALAPLLWLLASESKDGVFDASTDELEFRLRMPVDEIKKGLKSLIEKGFFVDASTMLAPCLQDATPETERETETEAEEEKEIPPIPPKGGKAAISLTTYLQLCKAGGKKPIPEDDPVFAYASKVGIPHDFLRLQWLEFKDRYSPPDSKRYKSWPTVFGKSVRGNWFRLWYATDNGYALTTTGLQADKLHREAA